MENDSPWLVADRHSLWRAYVILPAAYPASWTVREKLAFRSRKLLPRTVRAADRTGRPNALKNGKQADSRGGGCAIATVPALVRGRFPLLRIARSDSRRKSDEEGFRTPASTDYGSQTPGRCDSICTRRRKFERSLPKRITEVRFSATISRFPPRDGGPSMNIPVYIGKNRQAAAGLLGIIGKVQPC